MTNVIRKNLGTSRPLLVVEQGTQSKETRSKEMEMEIDMIDANFLVGEDVRFFEAFVIAAMWPDIPSHLDYPTSWD